jgi:hypothetical protein
MGVSEAKKAKHIIIEKLAADLARIGFKREGRKASWVRSREVLQSISLQGSVYGGRY